MGTLLERLKQQRDWPAWTPLALILFGAALIRLASLAAAAELPSFTHLRLDALLYHEAGRDIAAGDLSLGDGVLHMSPLYSYLVGAVYAVFGDGPWAIRLVQLGLGVATVGLVYLSAEMLWNRAWAIAAGATAALYGPLVFYESWLLVATLAAFLHALLLWLTLRAMRSNTRRAWLAAGLVCGLAVLARPSALLLLGALAVAVLLATRVWRARVIAGALVLAGCFAVIAPITARNLAVGGELVLVTDSGGLNFYIGNSRGAIGTFRIPEGLPEATNAVAQFDAFAELAERTEGRELSSAEINSYWYGRSWSDVADQPGRWLRLLVEKAWLFWNGRELPNTADYTFNRRLNPVLGLPLVQMWWLSPLALLGLLAMIARRDRAERVVALFIIAQLVALVAFFVLAHYRLPAVPALILAAFAGIRLFAAAARRRRWPLLGGSAAVVIAGLVIALWPKLDKPFDDEWFKLGFAYHQQGDLDDAASSYLEALAINGDNISAHNNLATLYQTLERRDLAEAEWLEVARIGEQRDLDEHRRRAAAALEAIDVLRYGKKLYSQRDEELIIRHFFGDRRGGVFLDIGSAHYRNLSTTYYLESHLGWSGIAVDALAEWGPGYAAHRPNTRFFNFFVTDKATGVQPFYRADALREVSSGQRDVAVNQSERYRKTDQVTELEVETITLTELLDASHVDRIDFLSMDIEEWEPRALAGFDIDRFRPELVCIEAHEPVRAAILEYFTRHGYRRLDRYLARDRVNWYFTPGAAPR